MTPGRSAPPRKRTWLRRLMLPALILLVNHSSGQCQEGAVRGVHDPCIIRAGDAYYLFSTGPGIPIRKSPDLFRWEQGGRVFKANPAWFSDEVPGATSVWAPDITHFGGQYRLYYSVSTFGSNRSCIGLATNKTLDIDDPDYRWVDHGPVLHSSRTDNYNAIDPNIILDEQGTPWMSFGSFWSGIKLTRLDVETGKPIDPEKLITLASRPGTDAVEAPFLVRHDDFYYLFASFDRCCRGVESTYHVVVGRSRDVTGPYVDRSGRPMLEGGGTTVVESAGRVRGPGHCSILGEGGRDWLVHHFYDADRRGVPTLQIRPLDWDHDGFPIAGKPIDRPAIPRSSKNEIQK